MRVHTDLLSSVCSKLAKVGMGPGGGLRDDESLPSRCENAKGQSLLGDEVDAVYLCESLPPISQYQWQAVPAWKVWIAAELKGRTNASNAWIAQRLHMGVPHAVTIHLGKLDPGNPGYLEFLKNYRK